MTTDSIRMVERLPLEVFNNDKFGLIHEILAPN